MLLATKPPSVPVVTPSSRYVCLSPCFSLVSPGLGVESGFAAGTIVCWIYLQSGEARPSPLGILLYPLKMGLPKLVGPREQIRRGMTRGDHVAERLWRRLGERQRKPRLEHGSGRLLYPLKMGLPKLPWGLGAGARPPAAISPWSLACGN